MLPVGETRRRSDLGLSASQPRSIGKLSDIAEFKSQCFYKYFVMLKIRAHLLTGYGSDRR